MKMELIQPFINAADAVLAQNLNCPTQLGHFVMEEHAYHSKGVAAVVTVVGDIEGRIIFDVEPATATRMASVMTGTERQESEELVRETICELANQVIGNAITVTTANTHGNLDLNVMLPVMARNVLESLTFLTNSVSVFTTKAIAGLKANRERAESLVEWSMSMVTSLAPVIGYDNAAKLAKRAVEEGKTVRALVTEEGALPAAEIEELLDARKMTEPGVGAGGE